MMSFKIFVVIPAFNEAGTIRHLCEELQKILAPMPITNCFLWMMAVQMEPYCCFSNYTKKTAGSGIFLYQETLVINWR